MNNLIPRLAAIAALALTTAKADDTEIYVIRGGAPLTADLEQPAALNALNLRAAAPFKLRNSPRTGAAWIVQGGRREYPDATPEQATRRFLAENGELFRLDPRFELMVQLRGDGQRAHVSLRRNGIVVARAGAILTLDRSTITDAALSLPENADILGSFLLSTQSLLRRSRAEVDALRARRGRTDSAGWHPARYERRYLPTERGLAPTLLVEERGARPDEVYALFLDAETGSVLRLIDLVQSGKGWYPIGPNAFKFRTGNGRGNVFQNQNDARNGIVSSKKLKHFSKVRAGGGGGMPAKGFVVSAHADLWDNNGNKAFNTSLQFFYNPTGTGLDPDKFDQVNTLYEIGRFYTHVQKAIGHKPATWFSLPVIVNVASTVPNAFFSPTTFPIDGHSVGYLVFYDLTASQGNDSAHDLSRDPTVVDHEYTHAWLAFEGLSFDGALDVPARAVNEAVADFFAVTHHNDTVIGRYTDDVFAPQFVISRNLADTDHFPETTIAAMALTFSGLPEEHMNGEIFGSFLVDLRHVLGATRTERLLWKAFPVMPHDMASVGFPNVTAGNSLAATEEFFYQCAAGVRSKARGNKELGAVIGAGAARGMHNNSTSAWRVVLNLESVRKRKFSFYSGVVRGGASQSFNFTARQGRTLKIVLAGELAPGLLPDFSISAVSGNPGGVTTPNGKVVTDGGRVVTQKGIQLNDAGNAEYRVTVTGLSGTTGKYSLKLDA